MEINALVKTLTRLVGFDTVSSHSNIELIQWVAERLKALGFETMVQPGSETGKANLFATIGPADKPGVMLAGHSDVVPVAGQQWTSDPFVLTRRDDRLYGRGSADMKGFIACVLEMAPRFAAAKLVQPVHIALSYNEETNMDGMRVLTKYLAQSPVRPVACVIGEPTSMQVVVANKGAAIFNCRVQGFSVHSSLRDQGVSAVEVAAEVICYVNRLQERLLGAGRNDGFEFPHTSVHVGRIEGGTAHNITARECTFLLEIRALPGVRAAQLLEDIKNHCQQVILPPLLRISKECSIEFETIADTPGLDEGGNRELADVFMPLCGCRDPHRVSFGTEGGILQGIGVPTIVCGPGEIRVAHQPDEYVEISQLEACMAFLESLCKRLKTTPYH
ncbi:MAG: acetylornithine deacetylase [Burkholderiaceae bacterium]|nr:acetylornithine deacetylase [Burkholderiaceae bacterium]